MKQKVKPEKFKLRISESGVQFDEGIKIDEAKDVEYFKVPPHNGLSASDDMYDFKMVRINNCFTQLSQNILY